MRTFNYTEGKYRINVFAMSDEDCPFVYSVMEVNDARALVQCLADQKIVLVAISGLSWEDDLSPWPAEKVFRTGKAFGGKADRYIQLLEERVLPKVEESLPVEPTYRVSAGYSLAGLCSLYALYRTSAFSRVVCASASLWYDGFLDFMQKNPGGHFYEPTEHLARGIRWILKNQARNM